MKNVILTGFMATGKTEVGRLLARRLGYVFVDCDVEIRQREGMTIEEIFRVHGERHFRDVEAAVIRDVASGSGQVIATGGGAVLREENLTRLRENGIMVCLEAEPETILRRTEGDKERPLLQVSDRLSEIRRLLTERMPFYGKADLSVRTDDGSPAMIVEEIIAKAGPMLKRR